MRFLKSDPYNPDSPPLLVVDDDIETYRSALPDEPSRKAFDAYLEAGRPYAIVIAVSEAVSGTRLSGQKDMRVTLDVVLEHRTVGDVRPPRRTLKALRNQVLRLIPQIDELEHLVPLTVPLTYASGMPVGAKYQDPTTLTTTARFQGGWRMAASD